MSKAIKVVVTQANIDAGAPEDPCFCPIALALRDAGYKQVDVQPDKLTLLVDPIRSVWEQYDLPEVAKTFITYFDDMAYVEPFEFELTPA